LTRVAVVGAGAFGRNHARVLSQMPDVELAFVSDVNLEKAQRLASEFGSQPIGTLPQGVDAAIVATPTITHEAVASQLLHAGIDVLVEKPIADSSAAGERLTQLAEEKGRVLQVGHLERFNPAVVALRKERKIPLFFEIHRLSVFTPRSLDVDVVLDLMIHDLDIVLNLMGEEPTEIRAAGISVLSRKVDIANVRLSFAGGCVANLTASRISTEQVRKLRLFQPGEYLAVDYQRQELARVGISPNELSNGFVFSKVPVERVEPLEAEVRSFLSAVRERSQPQVDGKQATKALRLAEDILVTIKEHAQLVSQTIERNGQY
jgi:predicted dehydrogenase